MAKTWLLSAASTAVILTPTRCPTRFCRGWNNQADVCVSVQANQWAMKVFFHYREPESSLDAKLKALWPFCQIGLKGELFQQKPNFLLLLGYKISYVFLKTDSRYRVRSPAPISSTRQRLFSRLAQPGRKEYIL